MFGMLLSKTVADSLQDGWLCVVKTVHDMELLVQQVDEALEVLDVDRQLQPLSTERLHPSIKLRYQSLHLAQDLVLLVQLSRNEWFEQLAITLSGLYLISLWVFSMVFVLSFWKGTVQTLVWFLSYLIET